MLCSDAATGVENLDDEIKKAGMVEQQTVSVSGAVLATSVSIIQEITLANHMTYLIIVKAKIDISIIFQDIVNFSLCGCSSFSR